jgi:hypothetical protein
MLVIFGWPRRFTTHRVERGLAQGPLQMARSATAQMILGAVAVATMVGGCTGSSGAPATTPVPTLTARPIAELPTPPATPTPILTPTPKASSNGVDCGDTSAQAVINDAVSAPRTLPLTRKDFTDRWNKAAGDTKTGYGLGSWATLSTSGNYTSLSAPIPAAGTEEGIWSVDYSGGPMSSIGLFMSPGTVTYSHPLVTGQLLQTMLTVFSEGPDVLRDLGVTLPLEDYSALHGINACAYFDVFGADFWVRLVQVNDSSDAYYLYIRSPSDAEKQAGLARAKADGPTTAQSEYAYPALGPETFAEFAPPLSAIPDLSGNPKAWITALPSLVIKLTNPAWSTPFIATVTPSPDGSTIYRFPADDGTPQYALTNPFNAAQMASGVDVLTFLGSDTSLQSYLPAARMFALLAFGANTPTGEGLFYIDGKRMACSWVGGTLEKPKRGDYRDSVSPLCFEIGGA